MGAQATMDDVPVSLKTGWQGVVCPVAHLIKLLLKIFLACSVNRPEKGWNLSGRPWWHTVYSEGRMKAFSNTDDIERMFNQVKAAKITAKIEKTRAALVAGAMHCLSNINHSAMPMAGRHWSSWLIMVSMERN